MFRLGTFEQTLAPAHARLWSKVPGVNNNYLVEAVTSHILRFLFNRITNSYVKYNLECPCSPFSTARNAVKSD
jgi:hypothetical protein